MKYTHRTFLWGFPEKAEDDYHNRKLNTLRIKHQQQGYIIFKKNQQVKWSTVPRGERE